MKKGAENRKKTIMAGALGAGALIALFYIYSALFSDSGPAKTAPPVVQTAPTVTTDPSQQAAKPAAAASGGEPTRVPEGTPMTPGIAATKLASTSAGLDPTLDESAMHRTESLMYSGSGRNIFSATYTPPVEPLKIPKTGPARPMPVAPPAPVGPPPIPPPPPINLKYFGNAKRGTSGKLQAFLLSGDDVYLANEGDIVVRKYKIESITSNSIRVTDLQNANTQTLPLQQ